MTWVITHHKILNKNSKKKNTLMEREWMQIMHFARSVLSRFGIDRFEKFLPNPGIFRFRSAGFAGIG